MNNKQYRMLQLLKAQIEKCKSCTLSLNGCCSPYFTSESKYAIIGEAPGANEIEQNTPFIGKAGKHLWDIMGEYDFSREQFLIINTVNCRPVDGNRNGKPTIEQIETCRPWIRKFIKVLQPEAILSLGNYALYHTMNESNGIMKWNGTKIHYYSIPTILSVHPSMSIYSGEKGKEMLRTSIGELREVVNEQG